MPVYKFFIIVFITLITRGLYAQNITTFAGSNINIVYNGGAATTAQINVTTSVITDHHGNIYLTDQNSHLIRKINSSGFITTIAGNGIAGYSGDGGPATDAELHQPVCITMDTSGNIYIADYFNSRVRKVTPAGIITTIAGSGTAGYGGDGGPATAAQLDQPIALGTDNLGNIYISDELNYKIRKVDASGVITTVVGNGTLGFSGDGGAATAAQLDVAAGVKMYGGNMYIGDQNNSRIRIVNSTGIISTFAGTSVSGFSGDGGPASAAELNQATRMTFDASGNMFLADQYNHRIRKINTSGIISTIAGNGTLGFSGDGGPASSAEFNYPYGVALDTNNNLYVADQYNNRIRKIAPSGIVSTLMGNSGYGGDGGAASIAQLQQPQAVCSDNLGNIYIADNGNYTIRKVSTTGTITTIAGNGVWGYAGDGGPATAAQLNNPVAVAVNSSGDVYVSEMTSNKIRMINHATQLITVIAGTGSPSYSGDNGPATNATINNPVGIAVDNSGNLYISDNVNNVIRKVDAATKVITTYCGTSAAGYSGDGGPATAATLNNPQYIAIDTANNLYIADESNNVVRMVSAATGIITTIFGNGTDGDMGDGGAATDAEICKPVGIAVDSRGGLSVSVCGKIKHIPGNGGGGPVTLSAGSIETGMSPDGGPATAAVFANAAGIACDANGHLLIADAGNRCVRSIDITSESVPSVTNRSTQLNIIPNPNNGIFELAGTISSAAAGKELVISINNVLGQPVYSTTILPTGTSINASINLDKNLPAGIYYCRLAGQGVIEEISFLFQK